MALSRNGPIPGGRTALIIIDMQHYCATPGRGLHANVSADHHDYEYFFSRLASTTIPGIQRLLAAFRSKKADVIFTYIESLTNDCRDQSLDYKLSGFGVPKGHPDAAVLDDLKPRDDEIQIPKTSCSVFISTNIAYVLRNLGVSNVVITGILTNQCVESAVRDAADTGFIVTVPEDACAAQRDSDHEQSLKNLRGFARVCTSEELVQETQTWQ
ncbi:hypothetical protein CAPTEDRAFT_221600 [Capitella teleta]|uniref:Isochorismatase-like domain-containing protein n=1 Tax=Capitella teleta TaxID=283909 RepID=R7UYP4_CAPTE|nr:hypothetical protein CAPTEDRAFT_221600 [Capitella teleta]|eukprot:ELU11459.1 hypothetical protein CAPTEDRAFT_221600 [Capitella teleta]